MPCVYDTRRWSGGDISPVNPLGPSAGPEEWEGHMRSRIVRVRTSDTEFSRMKDIASARGLSISELVRRAALGTRMPARTFDASHATVLARTLGELGRVGGNLNQLVRLANSGRIAGRDDELSRILAEVDAVRFRLQELLT